MIIQCTKDLQIYLKLDTKVIETLPEGYTSVEDSYGFHAHVKKICGRNAFIFMNNKMRYSLIFIGGRFPRELQKLKAVLVNGFMEELLAEGVLKEDIMKYLDNIGEIHFANTSDRQLIGNINELARDLEFAHLDGWEKDKQFQLAISQWENGSIKKLDKEYVIPREEMYKMIEELRNSSVTTDNGRIELEAVARWNSISLKNRKFIENNVFCSNCGCAKIQPGYGIRSLSHGDILITGKCNKCDSDIARAVESEWK